MGIHREVFQVHGTLCSYCQPRDMIVSWLLARKERENTACGKDRKLERHSNSAGGGARKRAGTNKAHFSILRHQEHVVYSFFPQSLSTKHCQIADNCPQTKRKRSSSLSCGFLFLDSLVKNNMSGQPWHTNLPSLISLICDSNMGSAYSPLPR